MSWYLTVSRPDASSLVAVSSYRPVRIADDHLFVDHHPGRTPNAPISLSWLRTVPLPFIAVAARLSIGPAL